MPDKKTVLLVEDNPKILDINRRMLEKEGLCVMTAKTIAEARENVKRKTPDLAVLDIMLPDGSGLDFLSELRMLCETSNNHVCALFLTAKAERTDIMAGLTAGGNDYITKPYDIDEFRIRVLNFLNLVDSAKTRLNKNLRPQQSLSILSIKELAVARLAAKGLINKEIADRLFLSESRVKTCLSGIYKKLGISEKNKKRELLAVMLKKDSGSDEDDFKKFPLTVTESFVKHKLTKMEIEIAQLILIGLRNNEAAERLFITEASVEKKITAIFKKYNTKNRSEFLSKAARECGMFQK